jgi:hypothetical protein
MHGANLGTLLRTCDAVGACLAVPRLPAFKAELRQALADPGQLPEGELDAAVEYGEESDGQFLSRLWRDLYGDEPAAEP